MRLASHCVIFESSSLNRLIPCESMFVCAIRSGMETITILARASFARLHVLGVRLTKQSEKMLTAVHVTQCLAYVLAVTGLDRLVSFVELLPLEPIEQDPPEGFVEVLSDASDDLLEDVCVSRSRSSSVSLGGVVLVQELGDRSWGWYNGKLLLLRDLLPVIDKYGLERIWNEQSDCWSLNEVFFLFRHVSQLDLRKSHSRACVCW